MIRAREREILEDLATLVAIPSVAEDGAGDTPYGKEADRALRFMLQRAGQMGFVTKNVHGEAGYVEYGEGDQHAAVLMHLDVVPAGDGWSRDPFRLSVENGRVYGRGVSDNKGSAVVALHCLDVLRACGITGQRKLRLIYGINEERGMSDIHHYLQWEPLPEFAFVPDTDYPMINREKGILQIEVRKKGGIAGVRSLSGGHNYNSVPGVCTVLLAGTERLAELRAGAAQNGAGFTAEEKDGDTLVTVLGKQVHAMCPTEGENACLKALALLERIGYREAEQLLGYFEPACDASALGAACADEPSGAMTVCCGRMRIEEDSVYFSLDFRYPVTCDGEKIYRSLKQRFAADGAEVSLVQNDPPLYVPEGHPLITRLSAAYEEVTGQRAVPRCSGGGSYARTLNNRAVGFGPLMPDDEPAFHQPDEYMKLESLMRHAEICVTAMKNLME